MRSIKKQFWTALTHSFLAALCLSSSGCQAMSGGYTFTPEEKQQLTSKRGAMPAAAAAALAKANSQRAAAGKGTMSSPWSHPQPQSDPVHDALSHFRF